MVDYEDGQKRIKRFRELPLEEALRLDNLCDCFEQQLLTNQKPSPKSFVDACQSESRKLLLRALLALEFDYLSGLGEHPNLNDYVSIFPNEIDIVQDIYFEVFPSDRPDEEINQSDDISDVIPNYTLLSELGAGGMGKVFRGIHTMLKNDVAIKVLHPEKQDDGEIRQLFLRETSNLGQLRHPHIVQALYAGTTQDNRPYLVMEIVRGLDLAKVVRRCGPISVADACEIIRQAALGLQHACECGMVHRDIKPSNLLLGWDHEKIAKIKVADFGLARIRFRNTWHGSDGTHARVGTLEYMPPEQFFTPSEVDIRADIFSLGCTLYALLVGQPPFTGNFKNVTEKMVYHRDQPVPPVRHLRPDVPEALFEVISWAMAKDPDNRFESPLSFANSLDLFNGGHDLSLLLDTAEDIPESIATPLLVDSTFTARPHA
ncbi:MAG: hypothetical protein COA78_17935 [Blastopirellula sp.]|nr:MAG: hypothetical protein COA78_17935 [Blastopirellula sp.]